MDEEAEARRLAGERATLRADRDFAAADALRDRIAALGFEVVDVPSGFELRPVREGPAEERLRADAVPSVLEEPATADVSVHWLDEGWPQDVVRGIESFRRVEGDRRVQHVVVEAAGAARSWPEGVEVLRLVEGAGWGRARNAGLVRSRGRLVIVTDGSIEAVGDVFGPIESALEDPVVGIVGPVGAVTEDLREFVPAEGPRCDAVEAYLMAFDRTLLARGLRFDPRYRFYRSADLDLSFQVLAMGLEAGVVGLPVERHEHRMWGATSPEDRRRLSRRNYYRFLDRWRGRTDLIRAGRPPRGG